MEKPHNSNKLVNQESLYLKQHSHQNIFWFPWGDEALEAAKQQDLPIFLSIGYSSCHWCHVMSHESFDNPQVAEILNDKFISIKVDREEYPDIDQYYQKLSQFITGRGGWPLSFFLTPDLEPIFCGTYFPLAPNGDFPGFPGLLESVSNQYLKHKDKIKGQSQQFKDFVTADPKLDAEKEIKFEGHFPSAHAILNALDPFKDEENGGYGEAPRFPSFAFMEWAVEQILEGVVPKEAAEHIIKSVEAMACGGIYDQARGGIHRYSTDKKWLVPHFEKMLYDQSGFLRLLIKTSILYPSPVMFDSIIMTMEYLETEMLSENNYFFSAQDADSEGVEGLYFCFTEEEFEDALAQNDEDLLDHSENLKRWFGITKDGNFENQLNVLSLNRNLLNEYLEPEKWELIRRTKQALFKARSQRIPPATDTKGLASWNFMMISALCDLVQYSKIQIIQKNASELLNTCLDGIHKAFLKQEGEQFRIKHATTLEKQVTYFEDFVTFTHAHSRLYEITGKEKFKKNVLQSLDHLLKTFFDGNFFKTRSLNDTNTVFENIHYPLFDQSFRSAAGTLIGLIRTWSLVKPELQNHKGFKEMVGITKQLVLQNPVAFGECLRTLIYPDEALKKIDVPRTWIKDEGFLKMRTFFSSRFLLHYNDNDEWQICGFDACEAQGEDFETFETFLNPKEEK